VSRPSTDEVGTSKNNTFLNFGFLFSLINFGEGALQKTGILQFFYRSGKVYTRCVEHSFIPHIWCPTNTDQDMVGKEVFTLPKSFLEDGVNNSVTRDGKFENLS
jgi:hypothetical protein